MPPTQPIRTARRRLWRTRWLPPLFVLRWPRPVGRALRRVGWLGTIVRVLLAIALGGALLAAAFPLDECFRDLQWRSPAFFEKAVEVATNREVQWMLLETFLGGSLFAAVVVLFGALSARVRTVRDQTFAVSVRRALLASATTFSAAAPLLFAAWAGFALLLYALTGDDYDYDWVEASAICVLAPGAILVFLACTARIADGLRLRAALPGSPTCEGCGYDLTARDWDQRCPECGRLVGESLDPRQVRPGTPWQIEADFFETFGQVLFQPTRFYRSLRVRAHFDPALRFARFVMLTLLAGGLAAALIWIIAMSETHGGFPNLRMFFWVITAVAMWNLVCCAVGHGLATGIAAVTVRWDPPIDERRFAHAACYEWAFAWVPAAFWGLSLGLISLFEGPLTELLGYPFGMPADVLFVLCGTVTIGFLWIWRCWRAANAIRWSNF